MLSSLPFPLFAILAAVTGSRAASQPPAPVVNLGYATYQGIANTTTGLNTFFGIRYAASPAGQNRWRAPAPPPTVTGIQSATTLAPQCNQGATGAALTAPFSGTKREILPRALASSEDCLFLNVYVPMIATKKLPVVVWIHGGGYIAGSAATSGEDLLHDSGNQIIAVLIQYRLGAFGFLPGAEVQADGVLNAGLLDQQFALQWVQSHIASFGGDPTEVTIWGESAGAGSVLQHLVANGGATSPPLFKRAMTSSTFLPSQYNYNDVIPEKLFAATAQQSNCGTSSNRLACLRAADVSVLQAANLNISANQFAGEFEYVPVVDGTFIRQSPVAAITAKKLNGQLLLSVTNTFEGQNFVSTRTTNNATLAQYVANAFPNFNQSLVNTVASKYSQVGFTDVHSQAVACQGEAIFICPTYYLLDAFGSNAHKGLFAIPPGVHGNDLPYYFTSTTRPYPLFNNSDFINSFSKSFMDVIMFGDVNHKFSSADTTPSWPAWSSANTEMLFNVTADFKTPVIHTISTDPNLSARCEFWRSLATVTKQ